MQAVIGGGASNSIQTSAYGSFLGGGVGNSIQGGAYESFIGGGAANWINSGSDSSTIGGGVNNTIMSNAWASTIGGGAANVIQANAYESFIGGGIVNSIGTNASHSFIGAGSANSANGMGDVVLGGGVVPGNYTSGNSIWDDNATISGGVINQIQRGGTYAFIGGGDSNSIYAYAAVIGGGERNIIWTNASDSTIAGGGANTIMSSNIESFIGGGLANSIGASAWHSTIGGGYLNVIGDYSTESVIGGGLQNNILNSEAFIGGGDYNQSYGWESVIGGGFYNSINYGDGSSIAGGLQNSIGGSDSAFIGGGQNNVIDDEASLSVIVGGYDNRINNGLGDTGVIYSSFIGGGEENSTFAQGDVIGGGGRDGINQDAGNRIYDNAATIGGGMGNTIGSGGAYAFIGGGFKNSTTGKHSTIGGGSNNVIQADFATIPGGQQALATNYGQQAYSSGKFTNVGDSQYSLYVLRNQTVSNGVANLCLDGIGGSHEISLTTNRACAFTIRIIGFNALHQCFGFHLRGAANGNGSAEDDWNNDPNISAYLGYMPEVYLNQLSVTSFPTVSVGGGKLHVQVTGNGTDTIRWTATVETTEIAW